MTVFKAFWKVVNKYKGTVILYTVLLVVFGGINMSSNDTGAAFVDSKPDILIVNHDENTGLTKSLMDYMEEHCNIIEVDDHEEARDDALFYRDVNYIIYIPENYHEDVLAGLNPEIDVKSTGDYQASLAEMMLKDYIGTQNIYAEIFDDENEVIEAIHHSLEKKSSIEVTSKLDTAAMTKISRYFNFASYSIMAAVIFIICLVLSSFHDKTVNKRIIVSSTNYKKHNRLLLFSSFVYSVMVWLLYVLVGVFLFGTDMFTARGFVYMLNTFLFAFCSLTIALLISTLVHNKNAVSGIVNVVALGSAFLCGAFIPTQWLPESVLNVAHMLPAYWYIDSNDLLAAMESVNVDSLKPVLINMCVLIVFSMVFIVANNVISRKKQRIG